MAKKILLISIAVIFFFASLVFYLDRVVVPVQLRKVTLEKAKEFLKREVTFDTIHVNLFKGVVLTNLTVYQKDAPQEVFCHVDRLSFGVIFIPGFTKQTVIIPSIRLENPALNLVRNADKTWNFSDLLPSAAAPQPAHAPAAEPAPAPQESPVHVTVGGVTLTQGTVVLTDRSPQNISETFQNINLKVTLSLAQNIVFDLQTDLVKRQGLIALKGAVNPQTVKGTVDVSLKNCDAAQYLSLLPLELPVALKSGVLQDVHVGVNFDQGALQSSGDITLKNPAVVLANGQVISGETITLRGLELRSAPGDISVHGDFQIIHGRYDGIGQTADGNAKGQISECRLQGPDITCSGNLDLDTAVVRIGDRSTVKGDARISAALFRLSNGHATAQAKLESKSLAVDTGDDTVTIETLTGDPLSMDMAGPNDILVKGTINANGLHIVLASGQEIKTSAAIKDLSLSLINLKEGKLQAQLAFKDLAVHLPPDKDIVADVDIPELAASYENKVLNVKTRLALQDAMVSLDATKSFSGSPQVALSLTWDPSAQVPVAYAGTVSIDGASLEGVPYGPVKNIKGSVHIETDKAETDNLTLTVLDTLLTVKGSLARFAKPYVNLDATIADADLGALSKAAADILDKYKISLLGHSSLQGHMEGDLTDPANADISLSADLRDVSVDSQAAKQSVSHLNGHVKATASSVAWDNLTGTYQGQAFRLTGKVADFKSPTLTTTLASDHLDVFVQGRMKDKLITISKCSGKYFNTSVDVSGSVTLPEAGAPVAHVAGNITLDLADLPSLAPALKEKLDPLKLTGKLTMEADVQGNPQNWQAMDLDLSGRIPALTVMGYHARDIAIILKQQNQKIAPLKVTGSLYDGTLTIVASADLSAKEMSFDSGFKLENTDLAQVILDTPAKAQKISGTLSSTVTVKGSLTEPKTYTGEGVVAIANGYLWDTSSVLRGLMSVLLIPEFKDIVFTEAGMNFTIADQKISTDNLQLKSPQLNLNGKGWVDFGQNIQMEFNPDFNAETIAQSSSLRKAPTAILLGANELIKVNVSGTLAKPEFKVEKSPMKILENTTDNLLHNVGSILQTIIQKQ